MTGEQNLQLIREIEANRDFLLSTYRQNPRLLARVEPRIRQLLEVLANAETPPQGSTMKSADSTTAIGPASVKTQAHGIGESS